MSFDFHGKSILVTGASRGIGYAIAQQFCDAGAQLFIMAEGEDIFQAAETLSRTSRFPVKALKCDITDSLAVAGAVDKISHLNVLVNNAGLERITPVLEGDPQTVDTFKRIIDTNVMGTYHVTRHAVNKMSSGSCMILTCSIWSRTAVAEFSAYCSSKHANLGFLRSMAHELAPRGIRVNGVCPGWVKTQASMLSLEKMARRKGCDEKSLLDEIVGAQLLPGLMNPEDVAATYLFLASDAAANITGQTITVDRGEQMS